MYVCMEGVRLVVVDSSRECREVQGMVRLPWIHCLTPSHIIGITPTQPPSYIATCFAILYYTLCVLVGRYVGTYSLPPASLLACLLAYLP